MNAAKNPTEKVMSELELSWLDASEQAEQIRLFIWRTLPAASRCLMVLSRCSSILKAARCRICCWG